MKKINMILSIVLVLTIVAAVMVFIKLSEKPDVIEVEKEREYTEFEKKGGIRIILEPDVEDLNSVSEEDMDIVEAIIIQRVYDINPESIVTRQGNTSIRVEIPDIEVPEEAVARIGAAAKLEFLNADNEVIMDGSKKYIESTVAKYGPISDQGDNVHYIQLNFTDEGRKAFKAATEAAVNAEIGKNYISITLDGVIQMSPTVNEVIDDNTCIISGDYTAEQAKEIASLINSGSLPFSLKETEVATVSPIVKQE